MTAHIRNRTFTLLALLICSIILGGCPKDEAIEDCQFNYSGNLLKQCTTGVDIAEAYLSGLRCRHSDPHKCYQEAKIMCGDMGGSTSKKPEIKACVKGIDFMVIAVIRDRDGDQSDIDRILQGTAMRHGNTRRQVGEQSSPLLAQWDAFRHGLSASEPGVKGDGAGEPGYTSSVRI